MAARWDKDRPFELALLCLAECCGATVDARFMEERTLRRRRFGVWVLKTAAQMRVWDENFTLRPISL